MKLTIGENIRNFRKKNDLTQEAFAERLGVTYQSVSRWENDTTYPDIELLPAIAEALSVTMDELLGIPQAEKEKRADKAFDELRRECMKRDYDADHIISLLRDIRRNYIDSASAWRPWTEGNDRAFRDPKVLPEVRLFAEEYLRRNPMDPHAIETMAYIEDEEHLEDFLSKYTTAFDCSARALLFHRYQRRGDAEHFETERRFQLCQAFDHLLCSQYLLKWGEAKESKIASDEFIDDLLSLIRRDAVDNRPDMWVETRLEQGLSSAMHLIDNGMIDDAVAKVAAVVELLEETMKITDEVLLDTSCRFLDGMEWKAREDWHSPINGPDSQERMICIRTEMSNMSSCYCIYPSIYYGTLQSSGFDSIRENLVFQDLCERVKALIVTRKTE